jgi:hypothetical protein
MRLYRRCCAEMDRRFLVSDPEFQKAVGEALAQHGEALVVILRTHTGGGRDYFFLATKRDWPSISNRAAGRHGGSDRVEVYLTEELPVRGAPDPENRQRAVSLVVKGEVLLARRIADSGELHNVVEAETVDDVNEWFDEIDPEASILVGPHPFRHEGAYPFGHPSARHDILVGYGPNDQGDRVPGAY